MATDDQTYRVLQLVSHDDQFAYCQNQAGINPVILNRYDLSEPNYIEQLSELIYSDGSGSDFIARCQCGETEGNNKIGMICPVCETEVERTTLLDDNNLLCKNWLASPKDIPCGFLSPKIYLNLAHLLSYSRSRNNKFNYLDDILNVDTPIPYELIGVIKGKGFQYLHDNFDRIMDYFFNDHPVISQKPDVAAMRFCLSLNRDKIFTHYIPILNSAINPIINSDKSGQNRRRYSDITADNILKAAVSLSRLEFSTKKKNRHHYAEQTMYKAYKDIIAYSEESMRKYVSTKKAIPRTHIYGTRFHWSFRAVIVPIIGPHHYYELHVPWQMAVNTLRVQLHGALIRDYGLTINQAVAKVRQALQMVDPDIKDIMDQMIEDSPYPGIPCVWDRPPSIRDGSVMLKYWTVIKTDLDDGCVGMTPLSVSLPNADFDGD